jgi:hypothetical protein
MKKEKETRFLEIARSRYADFPGGLISEGENPDFIIATAQGLLGIEVTQLLQEANGAKFVPHEVEAFQRKAVLRAQHVYEKNWGRHVQVRVYFSPVYFSPGVVPSGGKQELAELADGLVEFVRANYQGRSVSCLLQRSHPLSLMGVTGIVFDVPKGFESCWFAAARSRRILATYDLLAKRLSGKNARLAAYRQRAERVWLLVGAEDPFTLAGDVGVPRTTIQTWSFESDFDKVLVVSGMYSEVWELKITRSDATS